MIASLKAKGTTALPNNGEPSPRWRTAMDNFMIEFIASLFLILITVFCWNPTNTLLQFAPPLTMGLILLCLKDEVFLMYITFTRPFKKS